MYSSRSISERITHFIRDKSILTRLVLINTAIWIIINLIHVTAFLFQTRSYPAETIWMSTLQEWLAVPANIELLFTRPWTLITYMFFHQSFWHILFNMLWLYWFGKIFLEFASEKKMFSIYITGGIVGAFVFILAYNIFPVFAEVRDLSSALGASASVLAIVVATAVMVPEYTINLLFIGNVKIKYIALFTIVIDIFMIRSDNPGGHFAHLGGALAGLSYILIIKSGLLASLPSIRSFIEGRRSKQKRFRKVHVSNRPLTDEEYNSIKAKNQKRIDGILDKIAKSGYKSLTEEEKEFLFKYSNK
jgi:membrane associated rhomboid family serine protease